MPRIGIRAATEIINEHIRTFEAEQTDNAVMGYESGVIAACLKVLIAVTGHTYQWKRFVQPNGKLYSGICRMRKDSVKFIRFENCAVSGE